MRKDQVSMLATAFVALLTCTIASAQVTPKTNQATAPAGTMQAASVTDDFGAVAPYCDAITPKAIEDLQQSADKSCQTVSTCVRCRDRATGIDLYATLYAQPKIPKCNVVSDVKFDKISLSERALRVHFEVLQSVCTREGVNLEVSFPYARIDPNQYMVSWEVDGQQIGKGSQVSCVCGKTAVVTITEKSSGRMAQKSMVLATSCSSSNSRPAKN